MEELPIPLSRVELYLAKACGMDVTVPEAPESRLEQYLAILAGDTSIEMPAPLSLTEQWLAYILGVTPDPLLAVEGACYIDNQKVDVRYFAVAAGMPGAVLPPAPQNRKEQYFANLNVGPSGVLKYATGTNITLTDVVRGIEELQFVYGDTYQQTYSGKNLFSTGFASSAVVLYGDNGFTLTKPTYRVVNFDCPTDLPAGTYTISGIVVNKTVANPAGITVRSSSANLESLSISSTGSFSETFTTSEPIHRFYFYLLSSEEDGATITFDKLQVESGSSVSSFEPYVGGMPSPNPDYPQDINVVTGEQTIGITGKNLLDSSSYTDQYIDSSGNAVSGGGTNALFGYVPVSPSTQYTLSASSSTRMSFAYYDASKTFITRDTGHDENSYTITTPDNCQFVRIWVLKFGGIDQAVIDSYRLMFEKGSTVTDYTPFQGEQSYPISLGSTELCKIGDYRDYIYKSGDDWYVHKMCGKTLITGGVTEDWSYSSGSLGQFRLLLTGGYYSSNSEAILAYCDYYLSVAWNSISLYNYAMTSFQANRLIFRNTTITSLDAWKTWLGSHNMTVYYALATPTDTKITDATLVGQLEALDSAVLPKPTAYITVNSTSPNLPASLKISYYGEEE